MEKIYSISDLSLDAEKRVLSAKNIKDYKKKLGCNELHPCGAISQVNELHYKHTMVIPFESLDSYFNNERNFSIESKIEKIIYGFRGGTCTELNGLFSFLLISLGYDISRTVARLFSTDYTPGPPTHMVLILHLGDADWLCDVGFGMRGPIFPILLSHGNEVAQGVHKYRVYREHRSWLIQYCNIYRDCWVNLMSICDANLHYNDFVVSNFYSFNNDRSWLNSVFCSMPKVDGGIYLSGNKFVEIRDGNRVVTDIYSDEQLRFILAERFNVLDNVKGDSNVEVMSYHKSHIERKYYG